MKKYINKVFLIICTVFLTTSLFAQQNDLQTISAKITDSNGMPLEGVWVFVKDGSANTSTDADGAFLVESVLSEYVRIEAKGYKTILLTGRDLMEKATLIMEKSDYQMGEDEIVNIPFGKMLKRNTVGNISYANVDDILENEPGLSNTLSALNGRFMGLFGSLDVLGLGDALVVIDGIPRSLNISDITLQEIDQITVLKDATSKMIYGTMADKGIIMITTKRGVPYHKKINVFAESTLGNSISLPKYLNSADYMELYNESATNDGLPARYTQEQIDKTRQGISPLNDKEAFADMDYYSSQYLNNITKRYKINVDASGGNKLAQYFAYLGWDSNNTLINLGEEDGARDHRINVRGNIDFQINNFIKAKLDIVSILDIQKGANTHFWKNASSLHPNYFPELIPASYLTEEMLDGAKVTENNMVLGGTPNYSTNIHGELTRRGYSEVNTYTNMISTGLDVDLSFITKGLAASAIMSFDSWNTSQIKQNDTYAVYEPVWKTIDGVDILSIEKYGLDNLTGALSLGTNKAYRRMGASGVIDYKRDFNDHKLSATAVFYYHNFNEAKIIFADNKATIGQRINYSYKDKYIVEFDGALVSSAKLAKENRYKYAPSIGSAWVLSEEDFLKENSMVNYLKLRGSIGKLYTDNGIPGYYLYNTAFESGGLFTYSDGAYSNRVWSLAYAGNNDLSMINITEAQLGFESMLYNSLWLEGGYFYRKISGEPAQLEHSKISSYIGEILPYQNFNNYSNQGVEVGLNFTKKIKRDVSINIGYNMVYSVPKTLKYHERNYENEYRKREGKASDARFGLVADGLYQTSDFSIIDYTTNTFVLNNDVVRSAYGTVQPGDIKYVDQNNDGLIDDNDQTVYGNANPRFQHAVKFNIKYKNFDLFVLGTGQTGQSTYYRDDYYMVYGDLKYSEEVLDRYHYANNPDGLYPRLSANANENSHNFKKSTFWLHKDNWFNLQTLQLSYSLQKDILNKFNMKNIRIYVRGRNLLTLSKIKDMKELSISSEPQMRYFTLGINAAF